MPPGQGYFAAGKHRCEGGCEEEAMSAQAEVEADSAPRCDTLSRSGYKAQRGTGAAAGSKVEPLLRPAQLAFASR